MKEDYVGYVKGEFSYFEFVNGERYRWKNDPNQSAHNLEKISAVYTFTEKELKWISNILNENNASNELEIAPSYDYKIKTEYIRNKNKDIYREELDELGKNRQFTLVALKELVRKGKNKVKDYSFSGIYIIHNRIKDKYYVGKSQNVYKRSNEHFLKGKGNEDIYQDYIEGDEFTIALIPLKESTFSLLNDLEDAAIRAYESYPFGYNKMPGNILDKPHFKNEDYERVAELIIDKVKDTVCFARLTDRGARLRYTRILLSKHQLPLDQHFIVTFPEKIKVHQENIKKAKESK